MRYLIAFAMLGMMANTAMAQTEVINETLRGGSLPSGWTQTDVTFSTSVGGYANLSANTAVLTTPVVDLSPYSTVELSFAVAKFGNGTDGPITVQVSADSGATWTAQAFNSPTPTGSSPYLTSGPTAITATGNYVQIRFVTTSSPTAKRLRDVLLTGVAIPPPGEPFITISGTPLDGFATTVGTPSNSQSYGVSGENLTEGITVTAPAGFEVSLDDAAFVGSVIIPQTSGDASATVYARLTGASSGSFNGNITHVSAGSNDPNVAVSGATSAIYTWSGGAAGSWTESTNWSPTRTTPGASDILSFESVGAVVVSDVPSQSIAQLSVGPDSDVTLEGSGYALTILGGTGTDVTVASDSRLILSGSTGNNQLRLEGSATANISGEFRTIGASLHSLRGGAIESIVFENGGLLTKLGGGNPFFGSVNGAVLFRNGSIFSWEEGGGYPAIAIVGYEAESLYRNRTASATAITGRTFGNYEIDHPDYDASIAGASAVLMNNLTITSATRAEFSPTTTLTIRGDIEVAAGALVFNGTTVTLDGGSAQTLGGNGTTEFGTNTTLVINNGENVSVTDPVRVGRTLNLLLGTLVSNGNLTLASTATRTATVSYNGGTLSGDINFQRFYGLAQDGYRMIGLPAEVPYAALNSTFHTQGMPWATYPEGMANMFAFSPVDQEWVATATDDGFEHGTGRLFYMYVNGLGETPDHLPGTWTVTGEDALSTAETPLAPVNDQFALVANPYMANLDWHAVSGANPAVSVVYQVWDEGLAGYRVYTAAGGVSGDGSRHIAPFQGFIVETFNAELASVLTFGHGQIDNAGAPAYYGDPVESADSAQPMPIIRLQVRGEGLGDGQTYMVFHEDAINGRDRADASKLMPLVSEYATLWLEDADERALAMDARPLTFTTEVFDVHFRTTQAGTYTLTVPGWHDVPEGWTFALTDRETGTTADLRDMDSYVFTSEASGTGRAASDNAPQILAAEVDGPPRFRITASPDGSVTNEPGIERGIREVSALYPNPIASGRNASIEVRLGEAERVRASVYDALGREVLRLHDGELNGSVRLDVATSGLAAGVYIVRVMGETFSETRRLTVVR